MACERGSGLNLRFERVIVAITFVAMVVVILWMATRDTGVNDLDVGDCVADVPSKPEEHPSLPAGRQVFPVGGTREVPCSDSSAELRIVGETDETCETEYALIIGESEYCLGEHGDRGT